MSFNNWNKRLEIVQLNKTVAARRTAVAELGINFTQPSDADEGYYRKPIVVRQEGQKPKITGWIPVAYWLDNGQLTGCIGAGNDNRDLTPDEIKSDELWSQVVGNPVAYDVFCAVTYDGKPWPDQPKVEAAPAAAEPPAQQQESDEGRRVLENQPPKEKTSEEHAAGIKKMIASAPKKVETIQQAESALGIKNQLADLRLAADKAGRAVYAPLYVAYTTKQKEWAPMVQEAESEEKAIQRLVNAFRERERQRVEKENAETAAKAREIEEANARAADRAIANGEQEQAPEVVDAPVFIAPKAIVPTYGRALNARQEQMQTFVTIDDEAKVASFFRGNPELVAVLQKLAERAVKLGQTVPGVTTREGFA